MRLEIAERGPKEFYDEILYISANHKKYRTKPEKKVRSQTGSFKGLSVLALICAILFVWEYFQDREGIFLLLCGMMIVCVIMFIALVIGVNKRIRSMMDQPGTNVIEINERGITYESEKQTVRLRWNEIMNVLINRHSIVFMPISESGLMITIYSRYKDEILQGIEDAGHMDLVVDNTVK